VQKFTLPLDIYGTARTALREYWHYAYMRECLFVAGYSFLGRSIPESTILSLSDTTAQFTNSIAGVEMTVPIQTAILADNVLNVEFDYRLYRSTLMIGTSTLFFDTYTNHEDIHNFKELILRPELLLSEGVTLIHQESHVDSRGLEYLRIEDTSGQCGVARATPWEGLVYIHAPCDTYPLLDPVAQSLTFLPKPVSVHS
jgi:hypothetical protein